MTSGGGRGGTAFLTKRHIFCIIVRNMGEGWGVGVRPTAQGNTSRRVYSYRICARN
jgi:hypothetical protein